MAPASVVSNAPTHPHTLAERRSLQVSQRAPGTGPSARVSSNISKVVYALKVRSDNELESGMSAQLLSYTYDSIRDWIGIQRITYLPPEGSSYDKVLVWAQLFVERLHSFDMGIREFTGNSHLASQLAYGYCALLLELGKENASALMILFGFLYINSIPLVNLLEQTELFGVSQEIQEQLCQALSDLVTLVASVAMHFHAAIHDASTQSVSINIYSTFSSQIKTFHDRCAAIAQSMWRHQVLAGDMDPDAVSDVKSIKSWLAPEDPVLTNAAVAVSLLAYDREELTCLWVRSHLTRFLRGEDRIFSIYGAPGCGKSIVSSVIVDHLQRPISGVHYDPLFIAIGSTIPAESSGIAVAKAILSQLFEKCIGNIQLLRDMRDANQRSKQATTNDAYDNLLWGAVERALGCSASRGGRQLILIVDGVDEASCGEAPLFKRLTKATEKGSNVRLITLGSENQAAGAGSTSIQISEDLVFDDIMAVIRTAFDSNDNFSNMSEFERERAITRLTEASAGSFLWARLATKRLRREKGVDEFRRAVDNVVDTKPTVTNLVSQEMQTPNVTDEAKFMLAWLTIAERPLSLRELETLASIQLDKGTVSDKRIDVMAVLRPVNSLVAFHDGLVYIRHGLIRSSLRELLPQLLPSVADPHGDLTARLLLYVKMVVKEDHEPSMAPLDSHDTRTLLNKNPLLHFAVRYWPIHLTKTEVFDREGATGAAKAFEHVYPVSVTAMLLQASLWEHQPKVVLLEYETTLAKMHRELFKTKSNLTLQSVIFLAILHQQVEMVDEAASLFFEATSMSKTLLGPSHNVTMQMASSYIQVTESKVTKSRTDVMGNREVALGVLLECYKAQFGKTSTQVVTLLRQLVQHHRSLGEEQKVQKTLKIISSITHEKPEGSGDQDHEDHGHEHAHEYDHDLRIQLRRKKAVTAEEKGDTLQLDVEERDDLIEGTEIGGFTLVLQEAEKAAAEGHLDEAERLYLNLLQRLSREHRSGHAANVWAETDLRVLLSYSKFLKAQTRTAEASAILVSVWEEYSRSTSSVATETSAMLLTEVAHMMASVGLTSVALSVFKHCAEYYRATNSTQTSAYKEVQQSLQATLQEVQESASSSETGFSETTLEEMVVESSLSLSTANQTTVSAMTNLVSLYVSQHRWHDATRLVEKILPNIWPSLFLVNVQDVKLVEGQHVETCVNLAIRLAECYRARRLTGQEEDIRVRLYRALRSSRPVGDDLRERATRELLAFYQRTSQRHESMIVMKQEMLDDYTEHYGDRHPTVIKMLRELAELTRPRAIFIEYYKKMVYALNKDGKDAETSASPEALEPVIIVASELWSRGLFPDALPYYKMLFATFLAAPEQGPRFRDEAWVRQCFIRYMDCLRSVRSSISVLHRITAEYQTQCKHLYGATSSTTIHATLALAKICQESKSYEAQAITLYQELLQLTSDEIDGQEISASLEMLHEEQALASVSSQDTAEISASQDVNSAVTVLRKRITTVRETHGWAHKESLSKLTEMVRFYSKHEMTETAVHELRETTLKVLSTETTSTRLMAAASTIASSYVATQQVQKATELSEDIYRQIVMKDKNTTNTEGVDLTVCGRESLVFLAQLEHSLRRSSATLVEILASLTTQYVYFSELRTLLATESNSSFLDVLTASARLHNCLLSSGRLGASVHLFERLSRWFSETVTKRLNLSAVLSADQTKLLLQSLISHFGTHKSQDVVRSVGIMANALVPQLRDAGRPRDACDLAIACFHYIAAHKDAYHTPTMVKLVLTLGMEVAKPLPAPDDEATRQKCLETSRMILHDVLHVILDEMKHINVAKLDLPNLNQLISVVGEQEDWPTLASLLKVLWTSREAQLDWPPAVTLALARRYILAQWLVGDSVTAVRTAEHIVYNCRRVHGPRHDATLAMSVLLGQLYTGVAQRYQQGQQQGQQQQQQQTDMANRYYKKAAALHENVLRVFTDPVYASMASGGSEPLSPSMSRSMSVCTAATATDGAASPTSLEQDSTTRDLNGSSSQPPGSLRRYSTSYYASAEEQAGQPEKTPAQYVRQHLRLLKLAVQRLGFWPKDYAEYERLNAAVFLQYGGAPEMQGVEGVECWNVSQGFGGGKAEGEDDLVAVPVPRGRAEDPGLEGSGWGLPVEV